MKGSWTPTYNPAVGKYAVYRLKDINATDHSGNREIYPCGYIFSDKDTAQKVADDLNYSEEVEKHE